MPELEEQDPGVASQQAAVAAAAGIQVLFSDDGAALRGFVCQSVGPSVHYGFALSACCRSGSKRVCLPMGWSVRYAFDFSA